ncbi:MAG: FecR domain-containing protein [Cytophagales bacterium]|nr:FecR domain-containing protein [Cytophagales bacterium]
MNSKIHKIIIKSLSGEATDEELLLLEEWKKMNSANDAEYSTLQNVWKSSISYPGIVNAEEEFNKLWLKSGRANADGQHKVSDSIWRKVLKIAAVLVAFCAMAWLINITMFEGNPPSEESPIVITKSNPRGQKSRIFLQDGTFVWLNSSSKIEYQEDFFTQEQRHVSLSGEAYFEVAKDSIRPFVVRAGQVEVEVLGTMFNINTNDENRVAIALKEGSVRVKWYSEEEKIKEEVLCPREIIYIDTASGETELGSYNPIEKMGWKDGILYFEDASFITVKRKLEDWYGVNINVKGDLTTPWNYSGEFDNYVLENVLNAISFVEEFNYKIEGDNVSIMFN